jgi:hypothetical protein
VALKATNKNEGAPLYGARGADGTIFTASTVPYKKFPSLSFDDNQAAFDERKRLNITPKKRRRGDGVGSQQEGRDKVAKQTSAFTTRVEDVGQK